MDSRVKYILIIPFFLINKHLNYEKPSKSKTTRSTHKTTRVLKYVFSIVYFLYFGVQAYYTQADHLTGDSLELWGKIWFLSHDLITLVLALGLALGWYDIVLRKMALVGAVYQFSRVIFDMCWLNGIARTDSFWWTAYFFIIIFVMNLILFTNGRYFKK